MEINCISDIYQSGAGGIIRFDEALLTPDSGSAGQPRAAQHQRLPPGLSPHTGDTLGWAGLGGLFYLSLIIVY